MGDPSQAGDDVLGNIRHFVVLMLENRSFDHVLGALQAENPAVAGALDPARPAAPFAMPFDPPHEFEDIQLQLYGRATPTDPAPMSGFVESAAGAAPTPSDAALVMQYFLPEHLPVLTALAREYALINYWHSSLPGPTWPNRFFAHAATSGGLSASPGESDILAGFNFPAGTLYERLEEAGKSWRIYHDGLPQVAGIDSLRTEFLNIFTENFREMSFFERDLGRGDLPEYVFIEPGYDTGNRFTNGNSMHPLNDVRSGERLVKQVYESLRACRFWPETMLIVTFDEHGGFFDHVPPPPAASPGGDVRYADASHPFAFDRLGVRVPAVVVSAYTQRNTIVGTSPQEVFDHTSILATVQKRFGLRPITRRDAAARTLEGTLNSKAPRLSAAAAPLALPAPAGVRFATWLMAGFANLLRRFSVHPAAPLSISQKVQLALAHACNLRILDAAAQPGAQRRFEDAHARQDAAGYIQEVEARIRSRRAAS